MKFFNFLKIKFRFQINSTRGFVMPFTLLICTIILAVATSVSTVLSKELYFSKLSRQSQVAYYAADEGLMCATSIDDAYIDPDTGLGIFQSDPSGPTASGVLNKIDVSLNILDIKCATSGIFDPDPTTNKFSTDTIGYSHNSISGVSSTFTLRMELDAAGTKMRCAKITVNKTPKYRQIISQGYAECSDTTGVASSVERAVVSETENN